MSTITCRDCGRSAEFLVHSNRDNDPEWHFACSNDNHVSEGSPYSVMLSQMDTVHGTLDWMDHLERKPWFAEMEASFRRQYRRAFGRNPR